MKTIALVEPFAKATVSHEAVEQELEDRKTLPGFISAAITEDAVNWILTTNIVVADDTAPPPAPPPAAAVHQAVSPPVAAPVMPAAPAITPPVHATVVPAPPPQPPPVNHGPVFGLDSLNPSSRGKLSTVSGKLGVTAPAFWGRYFHAPGQVASSGHRDTDHYAPGENAFLRARGIRVLPIARQTGHVGQAGLATADADRNVAALFECFSPDYLAGADPDVLVFLDVEEAPDQPRLAAEYYAAWSARVEQRAAELSEGRVAFRPGIYTSTGARETFLALAQAMSGGAHCFGVWTARGLSHGSPLNFSEAQMSPVVKLACPTLLCQYYLSPDDAPPDENLDMSVCNPAHQDMLISRLVMPPN